MSGKQSPRSAQAAANNYLTGYEGPFLFIYIGGLSERDGE